MCRPQSFICIKTFVYKQESRRTLGDVNIVLNFSQDFY